MEAMNAKNNETVQRIKSMIEHAPANGGQSAADLLGWWTLDGWYVCAKCAGRIMARGCRLPEGSTPAWKGEPFGVCVGHEI